MSARSYFTILMFSLAFTSVAQSQDSVRHSALSVSVGFNNMRNKDNFQSPYTYKGTNLIINSIYTTAGLRGQHIIDLTYAGGKMKSVVSPEAKNTLVLFNYDYMLNLKNKTVKKIFVPALGIGIHTLLSSTNYLPNIDLPVNYLSGTAFVTLSGNALFHLTKKSDLRIQGGVPVIGVVYRPDFEINGKTLTKLSSIGDGGIFSVKLEYEYKFTSKLSVAATYHYNYLSFDEPRPVTILQNGIFVGVRKIL